MHLIYNHSKILRHASIVLSMYIVSHPGIFVSSAFVGLLNCPKGATYATRGLTSSLLGRNRDSEDSRSGLTNTRQACGNE